MQFAALMNEPRDAFAAGSNEQADRYTGAWRAHYQALVEAGAAGDPSELPVTGTVEVRPLSPEVRRRVKE
jgi:hypothetical protein